MKAKIFTYSGDVCDRHADEKLNEWLEDNPTVCIIDFRYQQSGNGHSIAILYKEDDHICGNLLNR